MGTAQKSKPKHHATEKQELPRSLMARLAALAQEERAAPTSKKKA
jgi:hypothetical protein